MKRKGRAKDWGRSKGKKAEGLAEEYLAKREVTGEGDRGEGKKEEKKMKRKKIYSGEDVINWRKSLIDEINDVKIVKNNRCLKIVVI
ncbi:hypothetical protein HIR72_02600 [Pasteurella multocida]|uniref:hypothetical protein n=1 Tax=Pasteurella multocida TaxID=747 RepID=UPI0014614FA6|nr:hypothetical protein [Pasteurella multocida]NMR59571.1 hypothetical protein [Pasteurella multocida]